MFSYSSKIIVMFRFAPSLLLDYDLFRRAGYLFPLLISYFFYEWVKSRCSSKYLGMER
jgi:hypothetical protein